MIDALTRLFGHTLQDVANDLGNISSDLTRCARQRRSLDNQYLNIGIIDYRAEAAGNTISCESIFPKPAVTRTRRLM